MRALRALAHFAASLGALLLAACVTLPPDVVAELQPPRSGEDDPFDAVERGASARVDAPAARKAFDVAAFPLASGQIVVSETGSALSLFFSLFTVDYARWVHAGIVAIEDGEVFVYDANGTPWP